MKQQTSKIIVLRDFMIFLPFFILTSILIFFASTSSDENNKGVKSFSNKDFSSAINLFTQAVDKNYLNEHAYLNLGLSQDRDNNPMKALDIYSFVANNFKSKAKFYSHFNQGELNGRLGKIKEALENYQAALNFQTKKKEIKENIEWLFLNNQKKGQKQDSKAQNQQDNKKSSSKEENSSSSQNKDSQKENQQEEASSSSEKQETASSKNKDSKKDAQQKEESSSNEEKDTDSSENKDSQKGREQKTKSSFSEQESQNSEKEGGKSVRIFDEIETKAILDAIENQESDIRARQFQNKSLKRSMPGEKDW